MFSGGGGSTAHVDASTMHRMQHSSPSLRMPQCVKSDARPSPLTLRNDMWSSRQSKTDKQGRSVDIKSFVPATV